jgi:iron complex outermembrane receptor protein
VACLVLGCGNAHAQSMDYGALEQLFGEPVTTSVTGSPQRASEVPASMTIITADDIRRSGARDIPGILRHVTGIDVLQWTNDQADVAVRGYNQSYSPRLLVLVNGRQVYADYYGYTPWSAIPVQLSDIRQIEIVKGPNSALFGFNAVGGVVNIITYDPLYDNVTMASVRAGTQNLVQGSATATFRFGDRAGLRISLGASSDKNFSTPLRPADSSLSRGNQRKAVDALFHAKLGSDVDLSFELTHSEVGEPEIPPLYAGYFAQYRVTSLQARVMANTNFGLVQATAYANWFRASGTPPAPPAVAYSVDSPVYVIQLQDIVKPANAHVFRLSLDYRHTDMSTMPLAGAHVFYDVFSASAMWSWTIDPQLSLTNAVRVDHLSLGRSGLVPAGFGLTNADWNRRSLTELSFNSGIVWRPDEDNVIRFTIARGAQLPNLLDFGGLLLPLPPLGFAAGIPTIKPTIVMNYEIDWDRTLPDWNMEFAVQIFHQTTHNIAANGGGRLPALGLVSTPANIGSSDATGLELSIHGALLDEWRWSLSYTPEVIHDRFVAGFNVADTLVDYEDTHPVHVVNASLGWTHGRWEASGYLRYESSVDGIRGSGGLQSAGALVRIPDYVTVDGRIAYRVTDKLTLAVSGQNLLDSPQRQTSAPAVERRIYVTASLNL